MSFYTLGSWNEEGIPYYLDKTQKILPSLSNRILSTLSEGKNLLSSSSDLSNNKIARNIIIKTDIPEFTGVDIYATFIYEASEFRNSVGYYVYDLNDKYDVPTKQIEKDIWTPLEYGDDKLLKRIIIFPNASSPSWEDSDGNISPGHTVKLLYDPENPEKKFPNNTGIGFFVISDGWNGKDINPEKDVLYSDSILNIDNSMQTILIYNSEDSDNLTGKFIIGFEDMLSIEHSSDYDSDSTSDSDFNDVIIQLSYTPSYAVDNKNYFKLPSYNEADEFNFNIDKTGMYFKFTEENIKTFGERFFVLLEIIFEDYTSVDLLKKLFSSLILDNNGELLDSNDNNIKLKFYHKGISQETLDESKGEEEEERKEEEEGEKYMYMLNVIKNIKIPSPINPNISALAEFQNLYINNQYKVRHNLQVIGLNDNILFNQVIKPCIHKGKPPCALGDPHITTIDGIRYDLPNNTNVYELYNDTEVIIRTKLDYFPENNGVDYLKHLTFLSYVSIVHENEIIIINMYNPDVYYDFSMKEIKSHNHFKFTEGTELSFYQERREIHDFNTNNDQYILRYIYFDTYITERIYVEIMFIPHRRDYINCVSIIPNKMPLFNIKGVLINESYANENFPSLIP